MIDRHQPKTEPVCVLPREPLRETRGRSDLEIVEHNDRAGRRLVHGQKESVLAFRRVRRTVDQDQFRRLQTKQRLTLRRDIEGLNRPKPVPATGQRDDRRIIRVALGRGVFELLGSVQPIGGILDARRPRGSAPKRMSRAAGTELEGRAASGKKGGYFLEKAAALRRKDPGRDFLGRRGGGVVARDEAFQLDFESSIGRVVRFSDNLSELLSPFRFASGVSARF